jgi:hypothetical protein
MHHELAFILLLILMIFAFLLAGFAFAPMLFLVTPAVAACANLIGLRISSAMRRRTVLRSRRLRTADMP